MTKRLRNEPVQPAVGPGAAATPRPALGLQMPPPAPARRAHPKTWIVSLLAVVAAAVWLFVLWRGTRG